MLYIVLSVLFSVTVSVMLKLARRYHIDVYQAITWNYSMAILLCWLFLKPQLHDLQSAPVFTYSALGLLLPSLFVIMALSVRHSGIIRTEIAQRLSLSIPIIAAFFLFSEKITAFKFIGIILGFIAIICTVPWKKEPKNKQVSSDAWKYLLIVFAGFGVIDVLFKQIAAFKPIAYGTSLFIVLVLAFIFSLIGLFYQVLTKKMKFSWPHVLIGWTLGLANFGNILFYLKAHRALSNQPSTVFSAMNIGVIVIGTVTGLIIFKEKLSLLNRAGLVIAIIAIIVIARS
jgi:drug/metabolite transporter (DMT)-like permease